MPLFKQQYEEQLWRKWERAVAVSEILKSSEARSSYWLRMITVENQLMSLYHWVNR